MFSGGGINLLANSLCSLNNFETSHNDKTLFFDFSKMFLILVLGFAEINLLISYLFLFITSLQFGNGFLFVSLDAILGAAIADKTVPKSVIAIFNPSFLFSSFGVLWTSLIKYPPANPDKI